MVSLYKRMQATQMVQVFTSRDQSVKKAAELHLEEERKSLRAKYRRAQFVDDLLSSDQFTSRRTVARAAKTIITEEDEDERHQFLCQLPAQGGMARCWEETSPELWVKAVHGLHPEHLKFTLNASPSILPTNANLHSLGKKTRDTCNLCKEHWQSLIHVLNNCCGCSGTSEVQSET